MSAKLDEGLTKAEAAALLLLPADRHATTADVDFAVTTAIGILAAQAITVDRGQLRNRLEARASVFQADSSALRSSEGHEPWLSDAKAERDWPFWDRYKRYLQTVRKLPPQVVRQLDRSTDDVLGELEDPQREGQWRRTGLVIGQVQSGKTGQFIGLVAKAADAGYRLIVVFAGIHNDLRSQTQLRIDEGLLGFDTQHQFRSDEDASRNIGVGAMPLAGRLPVASLTTSHEKGDFDRRTAATANVPVGSVPVVLVVKKNRRIIDNLRNWVTDNHGVKDSETGRKIIHDIPLFVIDDEADNSSINTSKDPDNSPSKINEAIRRLVNSFSKACYVGYTATPFANIYIDSDAQHDELGPDLFPESFIRTLRAPSNYLGPERLFGLRVDSADEEDVPVLPLVRHVQDAGAWMPDKHRSRYQVPDVLPESLRRAVLSFVLACAARRARGQAVEHNSMLVHVTRFTAVQEQVREQLDGHVRLLVDTLRDRFSVAREECEADLERLWEEDFVPCSDELSAPTLTWDEVQPHVLPALRKIMVKAVNGAAKDALDYYDQRSTGLSVIAVGGEKLSRGLTLEGLSVSYYLRASKTYDTLLQMGRWFGYRPGYEDLCRLYTTPTLQRQYAEITAAADELRRDVEEMAALGLTPREFGLKVRTSSLGLGITASNKMRQGTRVRLSYSGDIPETTIFDLSDDVVEHNFALLNDFLGRLGDPDNETAGNAVGFAWSGVDAEVIAEGFFDHYKTHRSAHRVRPAFIAEYIRKCARYGELGNWTVRLVGKHPLDNSCVVAGREVGLITRTGVTASDGERRRYTIKRVLSPKDESSDLDESQYNRALAATRRAAEGKLDRKGNPRNPSVPAGIPLRAQRRADQPLLLLYPLDTAKVPGTDRLEPLVGFAVSFPFSDHQGQTEYVVNDIWWKQDMDLGDEDEGEDEE
ncbi:Z1 domain-containing protein [Streptomyces roseolus]|uniref:Z1 domain-containing protein n=1 Tax=Streptomyces roseolus TaxID=67358 RepID=UPI0037913F0C